MQRKSQIFDKSNRKKFVVDWLLKASDSSSQRRALAEKWLEEGRFADYRYNVETCADGSKIYLLRPTPLNKGFDFQVNLEGFRTRLRKERKNTLEMPAHPDVIDDIQRKLEKYPQIKESLHAAISAIYECKEAEEALKCNPSLNQVNEGLHIDSLLRVIKWLFIEQDLTYWGWTGRDKFMAAIEEEAFEIEGE